MYDQGYVSPGKLPQNDVQADFLSNGCAPALANSHSQRASFQATAQDVLLDDVRSAPNIVTDVFRPKWHQESREEQAVAGAMANRNWSSGSIMVRRLSS